MEEFKRVARDLVAHGAIIDYYQDTMQIPNGTVVKYAGNSGGRFEFG